MILKFASFFIWAFVTFNLFYKSGASLALKIAGSALILVISAKYYIYEILGGAFFCPDLPRSFIILMECLYGSLIILFFLLLLFDIYLAGNWIIARAGMPVPQKLPTGWIRIGLACLALGVGVWATWESVSIPRVRRVSISIPKLPSALENFKIVQLTDLHVGPILDGAWLDGVVRKVNALAPDIVVITGDFIDGHVDKVLDELAPLADLQSRYGVFGVTGNHEYYWNAAEWTRAIRSLNVRMLENEHEIINIKGEELVVAGIPDLAAQGFGQEPPDLDKALAGAPEAVRLLLAHQPKLAREYSSKVDVHLAGHTHGGIIFFLRPLIARFNNGFVGGLYDVNASNLYVSPGTGIWNGFSFRLGVPAEITEIILKP
ncbi:MAG: metallophosphoesterase [Desulfovibrio sp.]|nr:metallophosphoesterase [Desulfovibrio sp.]